MEKQTIINVKGRAWQHKLLMSIVKSKEFPMRLRLFGILRRLFNLELLMYRTPSGLKLVLDFNDWVQSQIYYHGSYEELSVSLFKRLAKKAEVILDIGAHIGQYALECAQDDINKVKRIYAIEVNPKTFTYLLNNVQINEFTQVGTILGAVYDSNELLNIDIPAYWNMGNTQISNSETGLDSFTSASFTMGNLINKYQLANVDLVKLDVEGYELNIIKSFFAENVYPRNILFEFIPSHFAGARDVINLLTENGYEIRDITGEIYNGKNDVLEQNLIAIKI
jgi:FkbM family methyltransferase